MNTRRRSLGPDGCRDCVTSQLLVPFASRYNPTAGYTRTAGSGGLVQDINKGYTPKYKIYKDA
jgi:hypothetical protein